MNNSINNPVNEPIGVTYTELRRILNERETQWTKTLRELIADNQFYEDEILKLQQQLGLPLHLPTRKKSNG